MPAIGIEPLEAVASPRPARLVPPDAPGPRAARLEDLIPLSLEAGVGPKRNTIGGAGAVKRAETGTLPANPKRRSRSIGTLPLIAGLGFLLLAGGAYYYFGTSNSGRISPGRESSLPASSRAEDAAAKPVYDIQNLNSFIPRQAIAGNLFVITGTVTNVGTVQSGGIRLRATLLGKDNQVLMEQTAIAGNRIDENSLPYMTRIPIEAHLAQHDEEGTGNHDIPPGKFLPFMVVCFDPPGKVESFKVLAVDVDNPPPQK